MPKSKGLYSIWHNMPNMKETFVATLRETTKTGTGVVTVPIRVIKLRKLEFGKIYHITIESDEGEKDHE